MMNEKTIVNRLVEKGVLRGQIEFGWIGDAGPGIRLGGTYALLPIDDESDERFADWLYKEAFGNRGDPRQAARADTG
jgi:hypothetical protein